jgi:hypothetical protein
MCFFRHAPSLKGWVPSEKSRGCCSSMRDPASLRVHFLYYFGRRLGFANSPESTFAKCSLYCSVLGFVVPSNICLCFISKQYPPIHKANSLVATFASCSPYSSVARTFFEKYGFAFWIYSSTYSYVSELPTSSRRTYSIDKSIIFQKNARFTCVCAFFVVPLQRN